MRHSIGTGSYLLERSRLLGNYLTLIEVWHPAEDDDYPLMELINDASVALYPQALAILGQKMSNALEVGLTRSERVLLIGADCPVWTTSLLRQAMDGISSASALLSQRRMGAMSVLA